MIARISQAGDALEIELLGAVLRWPACLDEVAGVVRPEDFRSFAHQRIYAVCLERWQRGLPIDAALIAEDLAKAKTLEDVGGPACLGQLWDAAPTPANAVHYAQLVRDKSQMRALALAGQEIARDAEEPTGPVEEVVADAERRIMAVAERAIRIEAVDLRSLLADAGDRIDARVRRQSGGEIRIDLPSGFDDLDQITAGFHGSELTILAARPSVGKTALSIAIARNVAAQGFGVLIIIFEQSQNELVDRLLCAEAGVDGQRLRTGRLNDGDIEGLLRADARLKETPIYISDTPCQTMVQISAQARRLKRKKDIRLIVIDYLQLIEPDDRKAKRYEQVGQISRRLKQLARELKVPVLCAAQLNRGVEDRTDKRPRLSDLRESGSIEQDADTVLLLHAPADRSGMLEIDVAKQRNGPTGNVTLYFDKKCMRFSNYAPKEPL